MKGTFFGFFSVFTLLVGGNVEDMYTITQTPYFYVVEFENLTINFFFAELWCESDGTYLATIHNNKENNFMLNSSSDCFFGYKELGGRWGFEQFDGDTRSTFIGWNSTWDALADGDVLSTQIDYNCASYNSNGWFPVNCSAARSCFVCEGNYTSDDDIVIPAPTQSPLPHTSNGIYISKINLTTGVSWHEARIGCEDTYPDGDLASIHSPTDNNNSLLTINSVNEFCWIGLNHNPSDTSGNFSFAWSDGSSLNYINFESGYPTKLLENENEHNKHDDDCVIINSATGVWRNEICSNEYNCYVCNRGSTNNPSQLPSDNPSAYPSIIPSKNPSKNPIIQPTMNPTVKPSFQPTLFISAKKVSDNSGISYATLVILMAVLLFTFGLILMSMCWYLSKKQDSVQEENRKFMNKLLNKRGESIIYPNLHKEIEQNSSEKLLKNNGSNELIDNTNVKNNIIKDELNDTENSVSGKETIGLNVDPQPSTDVNIEDINNVIEMVQNKNDNKDPLANLEGSSIKLAFDDDNNKNNKNNKHKYSYKSDVNLEEERKKFKSIENQKSARKQENFGQNLGDGNVVEDMLMDDIVNDMEGNDEDVIGGITTDDGGIPIVVDNNIKTDTKIKNKNNKNDINLQKEKLKFERIKSESIKKEQELFNQNLADGNLGQELVLDDIVDEMENENGEGNEGDLDILPGIETKGN